MDFASHLCRLGCSRSPTRAQSKALLCLALGGARAERRRSPRCVLTRRSRPAAQSSVWSRRMLSLHRSVSPFNGTVIAEADAKVSYLSSNSLASFADCNFAAAASKSLASLSARTLAATTSASCLRVSSESQCLPGPGPTTDRLTFPLEPKERKS